MKELVDIDRIDWVALLNDFSQIHGVRADHFLVFLLVKAHLLGWLLATTLTHYFRVCERSSLANQLELLFVLSTHVAHNDLNRCSEVG